MSSPVQNLPTNELLDPVTVTSPSDPLPKVIGRVRLTTGWQLFMSSVATILNAITSSGTTAERPTTGLFVGRTYFDRTLGFRIDYNGTVWVNSAGAPV